MTVDEFYEKCDEYGVEADDININTYEALQAALIAADADVDLVEGMCCPELIKAIWYSKPYSFDGEIEAMERIMCQVKYCAEMHRDEYPEHDGEQITVYRGCSYEEAESGQYGYSWTTDRRIAQWFAAKHRDEQGSDMVVMTATVAVEDILIDFTDDEDYREKEIVTKAADVVKVDMLPADYRNDGLFWARMSDMKSIA